MLSFTLEGDRWRVAGTFDTGTLQQEFDRPSCKRSSLLLYLFFLFLYLFLSFSLISVSSSSFSLSVSLARLLARSCLLTLTLLHASYSIDRLSPSSPLPSHLTIRPTYFLSSVSPPSSPPPLSLSRVKYTFRERGMLIICKIYFVPKGESWKLQICPVPSPRDPPSSLAPLQISSSSLFFPSVVIFLFIYLRILPAFYFILILQ